MAQQSTTEPREALKVQGKVTREQQKRVERVIEVRQRALGRRDRRLARAHSLPAIEQEDDALVALVLVFARDQLAGARRRLPVDLPGRVANAVIAQLQEVESLAAPPPLQHADLREPMIGGEQRVLRDLGEVRVHAHFAGGAGDHDTLPQP